MTTAPGWYHAEGDPPGTQRYWDGAQWQGDPQPATPTPGSTPAPPPGPGLAPPPGPGLAPPPGPGFTPPPGPGFGGPVVEPPKKKSNALKWVLGILLLFILGVGSCTFAVWRAVAGPIDASNDYLNAIQAGDYDEAWALSDPACFPGGGPQELADIFAGDTIVSYDLNSTSVNNGNGEASGRLTFSGGGERSVAVFLNQRDGDWLVCGFDIGGPGS